MHNHRINSVRRHPVGERIALDPEDMSGTLVAASDPTAAWQLRELDKALAKLRREEREVILLVGLEGMRYHEAAETLKVPSGTVRSRLSCGRDRLRRLMDIHDGKMSTAPRTPARRLSVLPGRAPALKPRRAA